MNRVGAICNEINDKKKEFGLEDKIHCKYYNWGEDVLEVGGPDKDHPGELRYRLLDEYDSEILMEFLDKFVFTKTPKVYDFARLKMIMQILDWGLIEGL